MSGQPQGGRGWRRLRWWPVWLILGLAGAGLVGVWLTTGHNHQERNLKTIGLGALTLVLLLLWGLTISRLPGRVRWGILGGCLGLSLATACLVRVRGVTGDLIPLLEWRWRSTGPPVLAAKPERAPPSPTLALESSTSPWTNAYPQFLGPNRNAVVSGPALGRDWVARPPQEVWRVPVGSGWSGFAVWHDAAVTQEQHGEEEQVVCYDLATGRVRWVHADPARYATTLAGEGPRATPTIAQGRVFTLGATGLLSCLDLATGRAIWQRNIVAENEGQILEWGMSGSPLVWDTRVVVSAGGAQGRSLVAYEAARGDYLWGGGQDGAGYSSPVAASLGGVAQVLIFNSHSVAGHDRQTGAVLWQYRWPGGHPHVAVPVVIPGDRVLVSSGYGTGAEVIQVQRDAAGAWSAARLWKSIRLKAKFTNVVVHQGYIYGLDDGFLACLDAQTGGLQWKGDRYGHGQMILVGDLLLVTAENGEIALLEPVPAAPRELSRFTVFRRKTWNPPALAGDLLLLRNDQEAACYRLPLASR